MYRSPLSTPPPQSQFRRPWSPDPYEPLHSTSRGEGGYNPYAEFTPYSPRREASDVSVEALDLADYAHTLRRNNPNPYPPYPPLPSRVHHPPSFIGTPSLTSDARTTTTGTRSSRRAGTRAYSLPPPPAPAFRASDPLIRGVDVDSHYQPPSQIDVSNFPRWSRNWYDQQQVQQQPQPNYDEEDDYYPGANSSIDHHNPYQAPQKPWSPFDLNTPAHHYPYNAPPIPFGPGTASSSSHGALPWSADPPSYGPPLDSTIKQDRLKMLEREFGSTGKAKGKARDDGAGEDQPLIGSVDEKGRLVTQGPKKRAFLRVLQVLLALGAGIPAIYVALIIKPPTPPPPSGTPAAYGLYVVSILTALLLIYLFLLRPCCFGRRGKDQAGGMGIPGMMVLPVGINGQGKKGKKKGKNGGNMGGGDVQVNLIVDPTMFPREEEEEEDEEEYDSDGYTVVPGSYTTSSRSAGGGRKPRRRARPRRSIHAGLQQEALWLAARKSLKHLLFLDIGLVILWGAVFVFLLIGGGKKACPPGGWEGWCNGWNTSVACACLLCVGSGVGVFFDVKDLSASRLNPRKR